MPLLTCDMAESPSLAELVAILALRPAGDSGRPGPTLLTAGEAGGGSRILTEEDDVLEVAEGEEAGPPLEPPRGRPTGEGQEWASS